MLLQAAVDNFTSHTEQQDPAVQTLLAAVQVLQKQGEAQQTVAARCDEASLEAHLVRAVTDDRWRVARSEAVAARARAHATHTALLSRLIEWFPIEG